MINMFVTRNDKVWIPVLAKDENVSVKLIVSLDKDKNILYNRMWDVSVDTWMSEMSEIIFTQYLE